MKYHFKVHRDKDALWAECIELEGCQTQAVTEEELYNNMKEALDLYLDEPVESVIVDPLPDPKIRKNKNIVNIEVDPRIAFSLYVRHLRKKHKFTQQQLADMLGMKNIYNYQRLEKKANPSLVTIVKLKKVFPEFSIDSVID